MTESHWQSRLTDLATEHAVPGAVLGILRLGPDVEATEAGDEQIVVAHGVLSNSTRIPTTTDSVFQIGSITKPWTATIVMRLVEQGLLDLDAPVREALPELELTDPKAAADVTLRHLLTHTSGIDGDIFIDTGRGDDCVRRYVEELGHAGQNHPLGATWSYCNAGYVLAGRVIEKVTGKTWDEALREYVVDPLKAEAVCTLPEEAILHRAAVGHHDPRDGEEPRTYDVWHLPRSIGPAGRIITSAASVLKFARMHLNRGRAADGTQVLTPESVEQMASWQADIPEQGTRGDSWGLGWCRFGWEGVRLIGHGGATLGQNANLLILPDKRLAVVLLTNADTATALFHDLFLEIFTELAGVKPPEPVGPAEPAPTVDFAHHLGRYERAGYTIDVTENENGMLHRKLTVLGELTESLDKTVFEHELHPADDSGDRYVAYIEEAKSWSTVTFYTLPDGERYLHESFRATPRVGDVEA